jgi:crotonobetainyl-CoA:carnitine CoA-transferase CaiB-like acyl-CoA transferase
MVAHTFITDKEVTVRPNARDLVFETADGFITVGTVSDAEWQGLTRALERPEWLEDSRFTTPAGRVKYADARLELTAEVLKMRTSAEWLARLDAEQVPCAPVLSRKDLLSDPQIAANQLIVESEHPSLGRMRQPRPAARFDHTPAELRIPAPRLGEHTDAVLAGLGITEEELGALRASGAIG